MQEKTTIFAVTAIFGAIFLVNMQKIQKYHFLLLPVYIIIRIERPVQYRRKESTGPETRPQTPLRTKKPQTDFRCGAGLRLKIPVMGLQNRETPGSTAGRSGKDFCAK